MTAVGMRNISTWERSKIKKTVWGGDPGPKVLQISPEREKGKSRKEEEEAEKKVRKSSWVDV